MQKRDGHLRKEKFCVRRWIKDLGRTTSEANGYVDVDRRGDIDEWLCVIVLVPS